MAIEKYKEALENAYKVKERIKGNEELEFIFSAGMVIGVDEIMSSIRGLTDES